MSQPDPRSVAADASTEALVENATRLGLKWDLRQATIIKVEPDPHHGLDTPIVTVAVDGDAAVIKATSMIQDLVNGERVFVIIVPPGGVFIAGRSASRSEYKDRQTLVSNQGTVTFSDIPSNLRELEIGYKARGDTGAQIVEIRMRVNNLSSGSYFTEITQGNGGVTASLLINNGTGFAFIGHISAATAGGGLGGAGKVWFEAPDDTTFFPSWTFNNGVMASGGVQQTGAGAIAVATSITEIDLFLAAGSFIAGSTFYLRGTFS